MSVEYKKRVTERDGSVKVIFVRHLSTPGNEKRQYIGRTDEALSERAVNAFCDSGRGGRVYPAAERITASPMKRCVMTAQLIWPGQEIQTEEMLRECDFGAYERKTYEELKEEPEYIRWMESGGMTAFPGGEAQTEFRTRCVKGTIRWIEKWLDEGVESAAFAVHGGTIMAALSVLADENSGTNGSLQAGEKFYRWQTENGGGYEAEVRPEEWRCGLRLLRNIRPLPGIG